MIFGDNPTMLNDRYVPSVHAIMQAGNLYVYTLNNPIMWVDPSGRIAITASVIGGITLWHLAAGALSVGTAGLMIDSVARGDDSIIAGAINANINTAIMQSNRNARRNARDLSQGVGGGSTPGNPDPNRRGTQTASTTLYNRNGIRIDVENPNPAARPGQIHVHQGSAKYIYDVASNAFRTAGGELAPKAIQKLLDSPEIIKAIEKGLRYLGF